MKPFLTKARQQVFCAFIAGNAAFSLTSNAAADELDNAIADVRARSEAPLVAREVMLRRSQVREVRLSPDGKHLAYIISKGRVRELWMQNLEAKSERHLFSSKLMNDLEWSTDGSYLFMESTQGVAAVPLSEASAPSFLVNLERDKDQYAYGVDASHPHAYLISQQNKERTAHTLYRVHVDGTKEPLYEGESRAINVLMNETGKPQFIKRVRDKSYFEVVALDGAEERHLFRCEKHDPCSLKFYDPEEGSLFLRANFEGDLTSFYKVDVTSGARTLLHSDPEQRFDLGHVIRAGKDGSPQFVAYSNDYSAYFALTAEAAETQAAITAKINSEHLTYQPDRDGKRWLVIDVDPGQAAFRYFLYDTETGAVTRPLADKVEQLQIEKPLLTPEQIAPRVAIHYEVSDGMKQQGYVTVPLGVDPASVPLVVFPHGGPWGRSNGLYNPIAQFLANRGYAVFEPNFRSSTGFGLAYTLSANRDFGDGRVQQDIIDGMEYVLSRGIGDRERLAMVGHSFGGFSTLNALAFTPDTFKVGFAGAPPVDLTRAIQNFKKTQTNQAGILQLAIFKELAVDIEDPADRERMSAQSPDRHWNNITRPLYIWAGGKDPKVNILNVRDYALRLSQGGKALTYMAEPKAKHSPREELWVEAYYYMMERALSDHVGGRLEQSVSKKLERYLKRSIVIDHNGLLPNTSVPQG